MLESLLVYMHMLFFFFNGQTLTFQGPPDQLLVGLQNLPFTRPVIIKNSES